MLSKMFGNLTKFQVVLICGLLALVCVTAVPQLQRWFNSATSTDYEPWDPDNINVIKDKIRNLNKEHEEIAMQLQVLPLYEQEIASSKMNLVSTDLDSLNYVNTLLNLLPSKVFTDLPYNEIEQEDKKTGPAHKVFNQIEKKKNAYILEHANLVDDLGYKTGTEEKDILPKRYRLFSLPLAETKDSMPDVPAKTVAAVYFTTRKKRMVNILNSVDTFLITRIASLQTRDIQLKNELDNQKNEFNRKNFNINQYAVIIGIPFFIIAALMMYWYGLKSNKGDGTAPGTAIDPKDKLAFALNTITVLLLILSLLILGLAKVIAENTLAALLGTIGGYVLNNAKAKDGPPKNINIQDPIINNTTGTPPTPPKPQQ